MTRSMSLGSALALLVSVLTAGLVVYAAALLDHAATVAAAVVVGVLVGVGYGFIGNDWDAAALLSGVLFVLGGFGVAAATAYYFFNPAASFVVGVTALLGVASVWMNILGVRGLEDYSDALGKSVYAFLFLLLASVASLLLGGFSLFVGGWFGFAASSESRLLGAFLLEVMLSVYLLRRFENELPVAVYPDALRTDYLNRDRIMISYLFTFLFSISLLASGFTGILPSPLQALLFGLHAVAFGVAAVLLVVSVNVFFWRRTVGARYSPFTQGLLLAAVTVGFVVVVTPLDELVFDAVWGASVSAPEAAALFFVAALTGLIILFMLLLFVVLLLAFRAVPSGSAGVATGSMLLFVSALLAAVGFAEPVLVFLGVAGSLLVWDVGENSTQAERQLGGVGVARGEAVHFFGSLGVAAIGVLVAVLGYLVSTGVSVSVSRGSLAVALAVSLLGVLVLLLTLR